MEDSARVISVIQSFAPLQDYAEGKRTDYPAEEVRKAIGTMLENFAYFNNMGMCDGENCGEANETDKYIFFEKYLEQVCRLCPDAQLLCSLVSDDNKIGCFDIYSFPVSYYPYSSYSIFPYIIYKTEHGFASARIDYSDCEQFHKIYSIMHKGTQYYLLENTSAYFGAIFSLLTIKDGIIVECLKDRALIRHNTGIAFNDTHNIIFNPEKLEWKECRKNQNGAWKEVPNAKTFHLIFDKKISIRLKECEN
jgi:hypothetical protein